MDRSTVPEHIIVFITASSSDEAAAIARALVEERLAACANIAPGVRSIYRWAGAVHEDPETLLIVKTRASRFEALARRVQELHSYDTPEVIVVPVAAGSAPYLAWLDEAVAEP